MNLTDQPHLRRIVYQWLTATLVVLLISVSLIPLVEPDVQAQEWSAPTRVWVEDAGHTVDGLFLDLWREYPEFLGEPVTEEFETTVEIDEDSSENLIVQYFENIAITYSPDDERGEEWIVHSLPLGETTLKNDEKQLRGIKLAASGSCGQLATTKCQKFSQTGHTIRYGFKEYWELNGGEPLLGLPLTEEFVSSDGSTTQYFERAVLLWKKNQDVKARAIGKEIAKQQKIDIVKIEQPLDIPIYDEALFVAPIISVGGALGSGPGPIQGGYKEIVVSISQQAMWAYEDGELVASTLVSTGTGNVPETVTPTGYFAVHTKLLSQTMEGTISDEYYNVPDVPWVMYFDWAGNALHGTYWHNNFGTPMSHGCINLPLDVAEFLYNWAPEGTPVTVVD